MKYCNWTENGKCLAKKESDREDCEGLVIDCNVYEADEDSLTPTKEDEDEPTT